MQEISAGPLLDGLRKRPRHLNSEVIEATRKEMELEALEVECCSCLSISVTIVSSC